MKQIVEVPTGHVLAFNQVRQVLDSARNTYDYARFNLGSGAWIQVTYNRDRSVTITTNSRDYEFYDISQAIMKMPTQIRIIEFICKWAPKLRK